MTEPKHVSAELLLSELRANAALDILVVDDSPEDIVAIRRHLRSNFAQRYTIREANSAGQALRECLVQAPQCLLLDMRMPEGGGLEFLQMLRRDFGEVGFPVIVFTGFGEDAEATLALQLGAQDFLIKGQTTPELLNRSIRHARERFRIRRELARSNERFAEANIELAESLRRLEAVFGQTLVGIAQTDRDGRFTRANDAFCALAGRNQEELLQCRLSQLTGGTTGPDTVYYQPGGRAVAVAENVSLLRDEQGRCVGQVIVARDITASRAAERARAQLASIVEASADAIVSMDLEGTILTWNRGAEITFGYTANEAIGRPFTMLAPPGEADRMQEMLQDAAAGPPAPDVESVRISRNGCRMPIAETFSAIRGAAGELEGFSSIMRDIRARKQSEDAVRESEERYRTLANAMPQVVFTATAAGETDFINDRWHSLTGCRPADSLGSAWRDAIHPEDHERSALRWAEAAERRGIFETEHRLRYADGSYRWHLARALPFKNTDGEVTGWIGTCTDIEANKRAEILLRESENRLRVAQNSAGAVVWDLDLVQDRYAELPEFYNQFGFEPGRTYGFEDWLNRVHPEDRDTIIHANSLSGASGQSIQVEFRILGSDRWLLGKGSTLFDTEGKAVRVTGVNVDITERKLAEAEVARGRDRLRFALNAAHMGIWEWDIGTDTVDCSPEIAHLFGIPGRPETFALETFLSQVHPGDREQVRTELRALFDRNTRYAREFRIACPEGGWQWLELQGAVVRDANGKPLRAIGTARDITEKKELEARLAAAERFRSIGTMAGGLAHDFNNLLVSVIGSASLAQDLLPPDHKAMELLQQVMRAGERAAALTSQMLAYAGKGRLRDEVVDVFTAASEAMQAVRSRFPGGIAFEVDAQPGLTARGDEGQIREAMVNLLTNAAESYGGASGKVSLRIHAREIDRCYIDKHLKNADIEPGVFLAIEVRDGGSGIPDAIRDKIFEPFFSTKFAGRGLGLAAVAGIVSGHKGALHVNSGENRGTTVTLLLPALNVPKGFAAIPVSNRVAVLIVDDEENVLFLASATLKRQGYEVVEARNGMEALETIRARRDEIAVVLLDLTMPVMGGREVLHKLKELYRDLPVILSSGYSPDEALERLKGEEVEGFLQKPYTSRALAEKVGAWAKRPA